MERLEQVLDVVGDAGAGLVHRLELRALRELALAALGLVEVPHEAQQELPVQQERRADRAIGVDLDLHRADLRASVTE